MIQNSLSISDWRKFQLPIALLFFFIGVIFGFTDNYIISIIFLSVATTFLFLNYCISCIFKIRKSLVHHTLSAKQSKNSISGIIFSRLMKKSFFMQLDNNMRNTVLSGSIRAGELQNPVKISRKTIIVFVISIPICMVIIFIGVVLFQQIFFMLLLGIPIFTNVGYAQI